MSRCIYCLEEFESATREHILQNSLGARWESNTIVCTKDQNDFSHTLDLAIAEALKPIRNVFETQSGRGKEAPPLINIQASSGERFNLEPGLRLRQQEPSVKIIKLSDGRRYAELLLRDRTRRELGWALSKLRREVPDLSVNEDGLLATAKTVQLPACDAQIRLAFGGLDYFRGMLKSCFNLLAATHPVAPYEPCFNAVRNFIQAGTGNPCNFIRWVDTIAPLEIPQIGLIDQAIFIVSRGSSVEGIVQFFGNIVHPFQLTNSYEGDPIRCGYVVDPLREATPGELREPQFVDEVIPVYANQPSECTPAVMAAFEERMSRILRMFRSWRRCEQILAETLEEVLRPHEGQPFTPELADQLALRLAERITELIK